MSKRTTCTFTSGKDVWQIINAWAESEQFTLIESQDNRRLYQKGRNVMDYPVLLEISQSNGKFHMETWVQAGVFDRTRAMFLVPSEMGIESGGLQMVLPRRNARQAINKLLAQLEQPLIS
jgi:hypothetical protein